MKHTPIINNTYYLPNNTSENLYKLGFKYSVYDEGYIYIFPIEKYKNKSIILCKLYVDDFIGRTEISVIKPSGNFYSLYYNRQFGNAEDFLERIDRKISDRLRKMGFKKQRKVKTNE